MTAAHASAPPLVARRTREFVLLFLVAAAAAAWTVVAADGMWTMPGTMGHQLPGFVGMWTLMMAAMMLPSVAPFASTYSRTVRDQRGQRLTLFATGYIAVWAASGVPVFALAWMGGEFGGGSAGTVFAVGIFAAAGFYQLTPLKDRCLSHCRSPLAHVLHFGSLKGRTRDIRAGVGHGWYCLGCCWGIMILMVAFGVMNVPAMILLAAVVATEKLWRGGEYFSKAVGATALVAAVAVIWFPDLAPGLGETSMTMPMGN